MKAGRKPLTAKEKARRAKERVIEDETSRKIAMVIVTSALAIMKIIRASEEPKEPQ